MDYVRGLGTTDIAGIDRLAKAEGMYVMSKHPSDNNWRTWPSGDRAGPSTSAEFQALWRAVRAVLELHSFKDVARAIFDQACLITGATSGYVALLSKNEQENEIVFVECGGQPCRVHPDSPMPIRGMKAECYRTGNAVYHNDFMQSEWAEYIPEGHVTLPNIMFAPLSIEEKTVGILGLATKPGGFTDRDAMLATVFGQMVAVALRNSRNLDELTDSLRKVEGFNELLANREVRMIELKQEINVLLHELGRERKFPEVWAEMEDINDG